MHMATLHDQMPVPHQYGTRDGTYSSMPSTAAGKQVVNYSQTMAVPDTKNKAMHPHQLYGNTEPTTDSSNGGARDQQQ